VIQIRLKDLLKEKNKSMYWLSQNTGLPYVTVWRLGQALQKRIDLNVLNSICKSLKCTPGDLLIYIEDDKDQKKRIKKIN
jgi:putative transcriptional regulator